MKNGIFSENGQLIYYKDDLPNHAGVVKIDGKLYYAGRNGVIAIGEHIVHSDMSHGHLSHGTYTFDENGVVIKDSYRPPQKLEHTKHSKKKRRKSHSSTIKKVLILISIALVISAVLAVARYADKLTAEHSSATHTELKGEISLPTFNETVNLSDPIVLKLASGDATMAEAKAYDPYKPFIFNYLLVNSDAQLHLSEDSSLTRFRKFNLPASETTVTIDNLKTNTTYYYQVVADQETYSGSFTTSEGPRFLYIPGIYNTRDIGGYRTSDGRVIKQNMIIRGTEMDGLVNASYYLSDSDADYVNEQFGFVCDIDLRGPSTHTGYYTSPMGSHIKHSFYNAPIHADLFTSNYKNEIKDIFSSLADEENYPLYIHCTDGNDRTGTIVYLLQGLLGCSDEVIKNEYCMSGFTTPEYAKSTHPDFIDKGLSEYSGSTTKEKIESFLIETGVTKEEINSISNILLEN